MDMFQDYGAALTPLRIEIVAIERTLPELTVSEKRHASRRSSIEVRWRRIVGHPRGGLGTHEAYEAERGRVSAGGAVRVNSKGSKTLLFAIL